MTHQFENSVSTMDSLPDYLAQAASPEGWFKVVAHAKTGDLLYGLCNAISPEADSVEILLHSKSGIPLNKRTVMSFDTLKALFIVRHFEGEEARVSTIVAKGPITEKFAVEFLDGEVIIGFPTEEHWKQAHHFFFLPANGNTNNMLLMVERSSVQTIDNLDAYKRKQQQEFNAFVKKYFKPGLSQDECLGDYYFARQDYSRALEHYRIAREHNIGNEHILRKLCATKYNIGVRQIKQKNYSRALHYMELVLELEPAHPDALVKAQRLRERLRVQHSLADVHSRLPKCMDVGQMKTFINGKWIGEHHHFVLTGPPGSGKTRLACSLGHKVSKKGMSLVYYRLPNLVEEIQMARQNGSDLKLLRALENVNLLILDDWNNNLLGESVRMTIREIITWRYQRRSTIYIAELPQQEWYHVFGEHVASDPILNKVLHDAHKIHLELETIEK